MLARSTNSYSSTTPSRSGSQTATKPVGAECRFKVTGLLSSNHELLSSVSARSSLCQSSTCRSRRLTALNIDYPALRALTSQSGFRYYHDTIILIVCDVGESKD